MSTCVGVEDLGPQEAASEFKRVIQLQTTSSSLDLVQRKLVYKELPICHCNDLVTEELQTRDREQGVVAALAQVHQLHIRDTGG